MKATFDRKSAARVLHQAGLRSTPARRALIMALHSAGPLREEEIASKLGADSPDPATLYRNLGSLMRAGLVRKHRFGDRAWYFSLHLPGELACTHAHFVCESCGHCECLTDTNVPIDIIDAGDRTISDIELVVNGLCSRCRE